GVGALNEWKVRGRILRLQSNLVEQTAGRQKAETELTAMKQELGAMSGALAETKASLRAATEEKDSALANAAEQQKRAERLANQLAASRQEADGAEAELARYKASGMGPDQISRASELIKKLHNNLELAEAKNKMLSQEVANLREIVSGHPPDILLPPGLDGKVLAFDPKWQFVVLNAGEEQGVLKGGELLVN